MFTLTSFSKQISFSFVEQYLIFFQLILYLITSLKDKNKVFLTKFAHYF